MKNIRYLWQDLMARYRYTQETPWQCRIQEKLCWVTGVTDYQNYHISVIPNPPYIHLELIVFDLNSEVSPQLCGCPGRKQHLCPESGTSKQIWKVNKNTRITITKKRKISVGDWESCKWDGVLWGLYECKRDAKAGMPAFLSPLHSH